MKNFLKNLKCSEWAFIVSFMGFLIWTFVSIPEEHEYHKVKVQQMTWGPHALKYDVGDYIIVVDKDCTPEHLANTFRLHLANHQK